MALTVTSPLTEWDDCDTNDWTGDTTVATDADFKIEGTNCIGIDVDIETHRMFGSARTATDLSGQAVYVWFLCMTQPTLDTQAAGGMQICVEDGSANQSCWYVGGKDTYSGGWDLRTCILSNSTEDWNSGTSATLTNITKIGAGWKCVAKSKLSQNCFVDWVRYGAAGSPALKVSGTNTTAGDGWSEVLSGDETGLYGIIKGQAGGYVLKGPVQFGDDAGTATTDFTDIGSSVVWANQPVGDAHYNITLDGNATGTTDVEFGSVVGTGDSRQGVGGGSISTAGPGWEWDSQTNISLLDSVKLYGVQWSGAKSGITLDDNSKTSVISSTFTNCGEIDPGTTSGGAELLNGYIVDPTGVTNNYGLLFNQTPSAGTLTHNVKKWGFITSGTPTTQYMVRFPYTGDYAVGFVDMQFFGSFTSGTLWHGLNSGTNADITINSTGTTNANSSEFSNTASGTVTVSASVDVKVTVVDGNNDPINLAQTAVYLTAGTEVMNQDTNASGVASTTFSGTTPAACTIRVRKSSTGATRYFNYSTSGTIQSGTGLDITVVLQEDTIAS